MTCPALLSQIEEEQHLLSELRKIEARKRERERKTQDLQKLINSADTEHRKVHRPAAGLKKKAVQTGSRPPRDRVDSAVCRNGFRAIIPPPRLCLKRSLAL